MAKQNRLRGSACYLAGPMTYCEDLGMEWRQSLYPELQQRGVVIFDPTRKRIPIGKEGVDERKHLARLRELGLNAQADDYMKQIRRVDLRSVDLASFIIVRLDGTPTMGTHEEMEVAVKEQKPVLVWLDGKLNLSNMNPWLFAMIQRDYIFESRDSLLAYLEKIDRSPEHPRDRRWMLFDFAEMYKEVLQPPLWHDLPKISLERYNYDPK